MCIHGRCVHERVHTSSSVQHLLNQPKAARLLRSGSRYPMTSKALLPLQSVERCQNHHIPFPVLITENFFSSKAFIKHLPRISQLLNLNTLTTLERRKPDQTVKKLGAFKASSKMAQMTEILWEKKSRSHCDRGSDAPKLPPALKADI